MAKPAKYKILSLMKVFIVKQKVISTDDYKFK